METTPEDREQTDALLRYLRRNLLGSLGILVALILGIGAASLAYEAQMHAAAEWLLGTIGLGGLAAVLFVTDAIVTPVPPDVLLLVVAKSDLADDWARVVLLLGAVSAAAGNAAWLVGRWLGERALPPSVLVRVRLRSRWLVERYGAWAVALGALTPVPFSITCWTAGLLDMPWRTFAWGTLLRIPRFFVYYAAIANADELFRLVA